MGPTATLSGVWYTAPIPSGAGIDLSLTTTGSAIVTGAGREYGLQSRFIDSLTVMGGREQVGAAFHLTLTFGSGSTAAYDGQMASENRLDGTWTAAGQAPHPVMFYRQQP